MSYPSFYSDTDSITLYDPLADYLGAVDEGVMTIDYLDCVKLAGHSCPTVAGAYLMAREGLAALYPDSLPRRSEIRVELSGAEDEGVVGVTGNVIGYITGAGGAGGFKGIGGKFGRNDRLAYGVAFEGDVRLTRLDTGASVRLSYDPSAVPGDPNMKPLMQKALRGDATPEEARTFETLWQNRTRAILIARNTTPFLTITQG
jgi:formylmethanofuran dehydrogenase subunit E